VVHVLGSRSLAAAERILSASKGLRVDLSREVAEALSPFEAT